MTMNKKERAEIEDLKKKLRLASALRYTTPILPDVPPPTTFENLSTGYIYSGGFERGYIEEACSSAVFHSVGRIDRANSQGARHLFSTQVLALRALRYHTEQRCAEILARIDTMIELEESKITSK